MLMIEDCKPGALVECVDAGPSGWPGEAHSLMRHAVYTIKGTMWGRGYDGAWDVAVNLVEHVDEDGGFDRSRFRLLPEERLDIFRAMLVTTE